MEGAPADHDPQLAFIISSTGNLWANDRPPGSQQSTRRFEENERLYWNLMAELGRVFAVVPAYANDLRGLNRRKNRCLGKWNVIHPPAWQAFDITVALVRRLH